MKSSLFSIALAFLISLTSISIADGDLKGPIYLGTVTKVMEGVSVYGGDVVTIKFGEEEFVVEFSSFSNDVFHPTDHVMLECLAVEENIHHSWKFLGLHGQETSKTITQRWSIWSSVNKKEFGWIHKYSAIRYLN